jgi:hypothetical protein
VQALEAHHTTRHVDREQVLADHHRAGEVGPDLGEQGVAIERHRHEMGEQQSPRAGLARDLADLGRERVIGGDVLEPLIDPPAASGHHLVVDEAFVHQQIHVLGPGDQVVAHRGVARERGPDDKQRTRKRWQAS